jgi:hypothetical protein
LALALRDIGNPNLDSAHRPQDVVLLPTRQPTPADNRLNVGGDLRKHIFELVPVQKFAAGNLICERDLVTFLAGFAQSLSMQITKNGSRQLSGSERLILIRFFAGLI